MCEVSSLRNGRISLQTVDQLFIRYFPSREKGERFHSAILYRSTWNSAQFY